MKKLQKIGHEIISIFAKYKLDQKEIFMVLFKLIISLPELEETLKLPKIFEKNSKMKG
jgi:hypothetical protein